jgi:hypothetical protein
MPSKSSIHANLISRTGFQPIAFDVTAGKEVNQNKGHEEFLIFPAIPSEARNVSFLSRFGRKDISPNEEGQSGCFFKFPNETILSACLLPGSFELRGGKATGWKPVLQIHRAGKDVVEEDAD